MAFFTNLGSQRAVILFGKQPSTLGPSGNGYSVLLCDTTLSTAFILNDPAEPLNIDTVGTKGKKLSWRIKFRLLENRGKLAIYLSLDGTEEVHVGDIVILKKKDEPLAFWVGDDSIAIGNDSDNLGNTKDEPYRFFIATWNASEGAALSYSNNPASLTACVKPST